MPILVSPKKEIDIIKFNQLFNEADKDKSNSLDLSEVKVIFKKLGWNLPDEVVT